MKKLSAFWQKNRIVLIIFLSALTVSLLVIKKYITLNNDLLIAGLCVNVTMEKAATDALNAHCQELLSQGEKYEKVLLSHTTLDSFSQANLRYKDNLHVLTTITSLTEAKQLDYLLMDQLALEILIKQETLLDLRQFFTEEQLQEMSDRMIYVRSSEMDVSESYPVAVDVTTLPFILEKAQSPDKVYFGIAEKTPRIEAVRLVWAYLNQ